MAINLDAAAVEAKYGQKTGATAPVPMQEFYYPGSGKPPPTNSQANIPTGTPVPEGEIISQVVGRGQPAIMVVPPKKDQPNQPQIAVIPPQAVSRTTIGTFVEKPKTVTSPTVSNPLTIEQHPAETEKKPKRQLDLAQLILEHIWELGGDKGEEAQKFYDRSHDTLKNWQRNPAIIPLAAVTKFLQRKPGIKELILEELEPHFAANGQEGFTQSLPNRGKTSVVVCAAILERPTLPFMWTLLYLAKKFELGFDVQADTMIARSRNMLAHRFLRSNATWSLWLDGDIAAPIANPEWYKWVTGATAVPDEYTAYDVLTRLLSHSKAIVGGVYASRRYHGQLVIQPEIRPRNHEDKLLANEIRRGTARGIKEVDWVGFGCSLVHREVFLEVQRRFPALAPREEFAPWRFFHVEGDEGEDEAFCQRVKACSIPVWLDTQLICGHIGPMCFMPEMTQSVSAI